MILYVKLAWFNFSVFLAYPLEMLATLLQPLLEVGLIILFWSIISTSSDNQINLMQTISYLLIAAGLSDLIMIDGLKFGSALGKKIKQGAISQTLIKPVSVLTYEYFSLLGSRTLQLGLGLGFILAGLLMQPPPSIQSIVLFLIYLPIAVTISLALSILVACVTFYITEASGFRNMLNHIIRILSGSLAPLYLFPDQLQQIIAHLPFASAIYGPTVALQTPTINLQHIYQLGIGLIWAVVLLSLALMCWKRGLRDYDAIGL